ncbi:MULTISPECIES: fluoride efflux transporter CrcB [Streptomyces]|uniref:fluoride efflux transporter CrcB n=1 Tax=Streptomyces TaxID=1883 RepID=UPI001432794B|nr:MULTISPECIES: fluoride efflux transporter CrcB [Streptomyces]NJP73296.1 fluoride efflux transporter CrcB [Streptomyces sp. C1-2]
MTVPQPERVDDPAAASALTPARRPPVWRGQGRAVAVVALGGGIGATARYAAGLLWPTPVGGFPWATLWVNVLGCAVIGVFMTLLAEVWAPRPLVRPFFGTGVLGGFTTFSTYAVDIERLLDAGRPRTGLAYLAATLLAALAAVWLAAATTHRLLHATGRIR